MEKKFYILENLRPSDPKTGEFIFKTFEKKIDIIYVPFENKTQLSNILTAIKLEATATNKKPFIHIDCHGNSDGIEMTDKNGNVEFAIWHEISDKFRDIYRESKMKPVLCMSSCKGFNAIKMVPEKASCPYEHVSGSFEEIKFGDSFYAYKEFYEMILQDKDPVKAGAEIHNNPKYKDMKFICLSSSGLFELASKGYLEKKRTPDEIKKEKENTIQNAVKAGVPLTDQVLAYIDYSYSDAGISEYMDEWRSIFFS